MEARARRRRTRRGARAPPAAPPPLRRATSPRRRSRSRSRRGCCCCPRPRRRPTRRRPTRRRRRTASRARSSSCATASPRGTRARRSQAGPTSTSRRAAGARWSTPRGCCSSRASRWTCALCFYTCLSSGPPAKQKTLRHLPPSGGRRVLLFAQARDPLDVDSPLRARPGLPPGLQVVAAERAHVRPRPARRRAARRAGYDDAPAVARVGGGTAGPPSFRLSRSRRGDRAVPFSSSPCLSHRYGALTGLSKDRLAEEIGLGQ